MDTDERIERVRVAVEDALAAGREATAGLGAVDSNHFEIALVGLAKTIQEHAAAILHLVNGGHARSSVVLLRTLIELWITATYVSTDTTGKRAAAYIYKAPREAARYLKNLHRLVTEGSQEPTAIGSAGLSSREELEERLGRYEKVLQEADQDGVPQFPTVIDCAKAVGLEVTYRSVYGFLFSEVVHGGAGDTLRSLMGATDLGDPHKVLITTLYIQVEVLALTNRHFGRPDGNVVEGLRGRLAEVANDS